MKIDFRLLYIHMTVITDLLIYIYVYVFMIIWGINKSKGFNFLHKACAATIALVVSIQSYSIVLLREFNPHFNGTEDTPEPIAWLCFQFYLLFLPEFPIIFTHYSYFIPMPSPIIPVLFFKFSLYHCPKFKLFTS